MEHVDCKLAAWLGDPRYLRPCKVEQGESSMALLLLLWEVQHGRPFPAAVDGDNVAARLSSFSRRLRDRLMRDDVLRDTLEVREMQFPLAPALPASHQLRWAVQVQRPEGDELAGWYNNFIARWREHLRSLVITSRGRPEAEFSEQRPCKRARAPPP